MSLVLFGLDPIFPLFLCMLFTRIGLLAWLHHCQLHLFIYWTTHVYSKVIQLHMCVCLYIYVYIYVLFQILFHYRLLQDIEKILWMLYQYTLWSFRGGKIEELYNWRFMQQMRSLFFLNPFSPQSPVKTLACITDFSLAEYLLKLLISSGIHHLQC